MRSILILSAVVLGCAALTACDDPAYDADEPAAVEPTIDPPPMTAEDAGVPAAETVPAPAPTPGPDTTALPPDQRSSEESVEPESETLFY